MKVLLYSIINKQVILGTSMFSKQKKIKLDLQMTWLLRGKKRLLETN